VEQIPLRFLDRVSLLGEYIYALAIGQNQAGREGSDSRPDPKLHASLQAPANKLIGEDALFRYIWLTLDVADSNTNHFSPPEDFENNGFMIAFQKNAQMLQTESAYMASKCSCDTGWKLTSNKRNLAPCRFHSQYVFGFPNIR